MPSNTIYQFRSTFAYKLPSGIRFNLELATEVGHPVETRESDETPHHGQAGQYIPKKVRATKSLSSVTLKFYENLLCPAQYQLRAASGTNTVLNCFDIFPEWDVPYGQNFSAQVKSYTPENSTTEGQKMATVELELTSGVTAVGSLVSALAA
jgi:hypothetical protein